MDLQMFGNARYRIDIIAYIKQHNKISAERIWQNFFDNDNEEHFCRELDIMVDKSKKAYKGNGNYYIDFDGECYFYKE